ncbi:SusC/RagA family TonB-linked outer membrane protein [Flexithrix dorotheae]|uniref:SusC/RagA family TonB-linked outer membrane protein n=1 Tax=Flexithrix dorotheae TaxID=70993 RepID=UPI0003645186|nr:TonB-dependent receptor [Flexithrix dorotheae]
MKLKLLRQIIIMSKLLVFGIFVQSFFCSFLLANEGNAQKEKGSIHDIEVHVSSKNVSLKKAIAELERKTNFSFTFTDATLNENEKVKIIGGNSSVAELLYTISKQTGLRFTRINNNIHISKNTNKFPNLKESVTEFQQVKISGKVTDDTNEPLPGVSILIKGTSSGTTTDFDGNYSLSVTEGSTLQFSYIGYVTQELEVGAQSVIDVSLKTDLAQLEEVVVIGYGEKSRTLLTESIGTMDSEEIQKLPISSADQALQGRISGVQVTPMDGTPGAPTAIRIRGVGTVGNAQPLFVIDGVPVGKNTGGNPNGPITNPLSTLNPSDIESISVLKDASAAAVYGVRAANGVVIITTKRGKQGKPQINFDGYYGVQKLPSMWDMNNTDQYIALTEEAYNNFNIQNELSPDDPSYLILHPDLQPGSPYRSINEDWAGDVKNNNAPIQNYNLSVSGANDNANYFVSAGYFNQDAVLNKWELDRYTFRANADYKVGKRFKFGNTFTMSYQEVFRGVNGGGDGFLLANAATMPPFFEIYDYRNEIPGNRYGYNGNEDVNGLIIGNQNGINQIRDNYDRSTRMLGSIYGELEIINGLKFKSMASIDMNWGRNDSWNPGYTAAEMGLNRPNQERTDSRSEGYTQVFTNTLNYDKNFGDHNFNVLAGLEYQKLRSTSLSGRGENFLSADPDFYINVKNASENLLIGGGAGEGAYVGYIGRFSYDYMKKYLVTATVRRDGTSSFSPEDDRRWGTFPSVSAAWRVSEEDFFNGINAISELKIRGSWGQLGNDQTTAFPHVFRVSPTPDYGLAGSTSVQAPAPVNFVNKEVIWETNETFDVGFDMTFLDNKFDLLMTYYKRTTKDFLISLPLPRITGFENTPANVGEVVNSGIELELGYHQNFGEFNLDIATNLTTVKNELTALAPGIEEFSSNEIYRTGIGQPIGYFYGYQTAGIYQTDAEAANALPDANSQGARAGDVIFVDNNGPAPEGAPDGQQFSGEPDGEINFNDRTYLGKTIPDFYYGINVGANYKGFDLSIFFQGVSGVQLYNEFRRDGERLTGSGRNVMSTTANRWTGPGTSNTMPRAIATDPNDNNRFSDRFVEDAGYFRMKNLQLGYSLPKSLLDKTNSIQNVRVYVSGSNLLTITNYSGPDPEVFTYRAISNQLGAGTDQGNIPQTRTLQLGLQVGF